MPKFIAKMTIEVEVNIEARNEDAALKKAEQLEIDLNFKIPTKLKSSVSEEWSSLEDSYGWEIEDA